jgi:hypothetical protein
MQTQAQVVSLHGDRDREPNEKALRTELGDAIQNRKAAHGRARLAAEAKARALTALLGAESEVDKLEAAKKRAADAATERRARGLAEALRAGSPIPEAIPSEAPDMAALAAARAHRDALQLAHAELAAESTKAKEELSAAAANVENFIDAILDGEVRTVAAEMISAIELHWRLYDRLCGLLLIDERRQAPRLDDLAADVRLKINRRKREAARDPSLIEDRYWREFLSGHDTEHERQWEDYRNRLSADHNARFDDGGAA